MKKSRTGRRGGSHAGGFMVLLAIVLGLALTAALGRAVSATRAWLQRDSTPPASQAVETGQPGRAG